MVIRVIRPQQVTTQEGAVVGNSCQHRFFQNNIVIDDQEHYISLSE